MNVTTVCPVRDLLGRIGDRWSVLVLVTLRSEPVRYNELLRRVDGISRRMLTLTLRSLERDGLVSRSVYPTVPPSVEYSLTPLAMELAEPLSALADWARRHHPEVLAARHRYDTAPRPAGVG